MLQYINSLNFNQHIKQKSFPTNINQKHYNTRGLYPLQCDTVYFTGMSAPSHYKSVFDYLAADILNKNKKFQVDGSFLSASNIQTAIDKLFNMNKVYGPYTESITDKIKWKSYIPEDIRIFSINKINEARASRLHEWQKFLETPQLTEYNEKYPELVKKIRENKSLRFVIWNSINSELKNNNRHIPVPFDPIALYKTIIGYEKIEPIDRAVRCSSPTFIEIYTHRLRDTLLEAKGLSESQKLWVRIPSIKNEPKNKTDNIHALEVLSNRNWCTRSSVDKAEAALEDGDFYIYLERDKYKQWQPLIGMASSKGKIDQIQGANNNNIIPTSEIDNVKEYIKSQGLKCQSAIIPEGPKAYQQILISEKLAEYNDVLGKTFEKAIKDNDDYAIFTFINQKISKLDNGKYEIGTYKPSFNANPTSGISIPYSMMGIDEDILLQNVEVINGDLILHNKNELFSSSITKFPQSLTTVTGKIICSAEQYKKFGQDIDRITNGNKNKVIIRV